MRTANSGLQPLTLVAILAMTGTALWLGVGSWLSDDVGASETRGATVQRGPLEIRVVERGNLKAADAVSLKNEVEGQTTILKLVPEGTMVQEGELLCELDATSLIEDRFQRQISVRNAEAAYVKSKQNFEIQTSQNDSDVKAAEQQLFFADMDLKKFQEGERLAKEAEAEEAIKLGEEEFTRAQEKLTWSQKLNEKGFLTDTELEADALSLSRAQIQLEQEKRNKDLLVRFQLPRDEADLRSKLDEARRELERVKLQAAARIVDYEADMNTNEAKLALEKENLTKIESQIAKAELVAPRAGMVVYSQEEGGRYGMSQPIKEGTQVRERQEIITIPSADGMIAQVSLHESVLKQIEIAQRATINVDALPGRQFTGAVRFVAVMADQNTYWANPNLRLYRTEVTIADPVPEMRPGMSCSIEIQVEDISDTLFVPVQAVFRRGSDNLAFVDHGGSSEERAVEVGRYNDRWVQVLSGLSEGEVVLLSPPSGFEPEAEEPTAPDAAPGATPGAPAVATPGAVPAPGGAHTAQGPADASAAAERGGEGRGDGERGGEGRGERRERTEGEGGERGSDPARAAEFKKRMEGMSAEERAKLIEGFRGRDGGGERREGSDKSATGG